MIVKISDTLYIDFAKVQVVVLEYGEACVYFDKKRSAAFRVTNPENVKTIKLYLDAIRWTQ